MWSVFCEVGTKLVNIIWRYFISEKPFTICDLPASLTSDLLGGAVSEHEREGIAQCVSLFVLCFVYHVERTWKMEQILRRDG
jgi:hypothetical protein